VVLVVLCNVHETECTNRAVLAVTEQLDESGARNAMCVARRKGVQSTSSSVVSRTSHLHRSSSCAGGSRRHSLRRSSYVL